VLDAQVFTAPPIEATTNTEPLLAFAEAVAGRRLPVAELAVALLEPLESLIPPEASAVLLLRRNETLELQAIRRKSTLATQPIRLEGDAAQRWSSRETYYVPDVRDTDVIGNHLAIEYDPPVRTLAVVPVLDPDGARVAALGITHPEPEAFLSEQISSLERLARLAGAALALPQLD
jgi:GAF domain-containing protein